MRLLLLLLALPFVAATFRHSSGQLAAAESYHQYATLISSLVRQYSAPATGNTAYITKIDIARDGGMKIYFSGKGKPEQYNVFQLHKTYDNMDGIVLNEALGTVTLWLTANNKSVLHFAEISKAKEIYAAFLALIAAGKETYVPDLPLDINEAVDSINSILATHSKGAKFRVSLSGTAIITTGNMQFFSFNIAELASSVYREGFEVQGIQMVPCTYQKVAANNWIRFNTTKGTVAFLKFDCISDEELAKLHQLFIYVRASMINIMYS